MATRGVNKVITYEENLYLSGLSIPQVSRMTGIGRSTLRFRLHKRGVLRSRSDGVRMAAAEGRLSGNKGKKRVFSKEWKKNISKAKAGVGVGTSKKPNGYIEMTMGENKGRGEHRVIMELAIGRKLNSHECVHHINEIKSDNRIDNLQLMTRSEHARLHATENDKRRDRDGNGRYL